MRSVIISLLIALPCTLHAAAKPSIEIYPQALEALKAQPAAPAPLPPMTAILPNPTIPAVTPAPVIPPVKQPETKTEAVIAKPEPKPEPVVTKPEPKPEFIITNPEPKLEPKPEPKPEPVVITKPEPAKKAWWENVTESVTDAASRVGESVAPKEEAPAQPAATAAPEPAAKKALPDLSKAPAHLPSMKALIGDEEAAKQATESVVKEDDLPKPDANAQTLTAGEIKPQPKKEKRLKSEAKPGKKPAATKAVEQQTPAVEVQAPKPPPPAPPVPEAKQAPAAITQPAAIEPPAAAAPPQAVSAPEPKALPEKVKAAASISFADNSRNLSAEATSKVADFAAKVKGTNQKIVVTGYGNTRTSTWRRDTLSQVLAVRAELIEKGVASGDINVQVEGSDSKVNQVEVITK